MFREKLFDFIAGIRGVIASASLKPGDSTLFWAARSAAYPRRYCLGLIEAITAFIVFLHHCAGIRGVIASASLKLYNPAGAGEFEIGIRGVIASASLKQFRPLRNHLLSGEGIRGVIASASLKRWFIRRFRNGYTRYPRRYCLGLIEASIGIRRYWTTSHGIRGVIASASLKHARI